jgi:hypothetical protein
MYSFRQGHFSLQEIFEFTLTVRFTMIFNTINIQPILRLVG